MTNEHFPPISIAASDFHQLQQAATLALAEHDPVSRFLVSELRRADVIESAAPLHCVRLDHWVTFRADDESLLESRVLVLPRNFRSNHLHVSVLSPLGAALIGLPAGSRMPYAGIDGTRHVVTVESLVPPVGVISLQQRRAAKFSRTTTATIQTGPAQQQHEGKTMVSHLQPELPPISLRLRDADRLRNIAEAAADKYPQTTEFLAREIDRAEILPDTHLLPGLVTMESEVVFRDDISMQERSVTLVYPEAADVDTGKISILTPIGAALIGLSVGQTIEFQTPGGRWRSLTVMRVVNPS